MQQPGAIGYVVINYDGKPPCLRIWNANATVVGIPVKSHPEETIQAV